MAWGAQGCMCCVKGGVFLRRHGAITEQDSSAQPTFLELPQISLSASRVLSDIALGWLFSSVFPHSTTSLFLCMHPTNRIQWLIMSGAQIKAAGIVSSLSSRAHRAQSLKTPGEYGINSTKTLLISKERIKHISQSKLPTIHILLGIYRHSSPSPLSPTRPRLRPSLIWTVLSLFLYSSGIICKNRKLTYIPHHLEIYNPGVHTSMVPKVNKSGIQIKNPPKPLDTHGLMGCADGMESVQLEDDSGLTGQVNNYRFLEKVGRRLKVSNRRYMNRRQQCGEERRGPLAKGKESPLKK